MSNTEWDGQGLPPIGVVCEINTPFYNSGTKVRVLCHDQGAAICRAEDGDTLGSLCELQAGEVRPIRTPEKIAAEEHALEIQKMVDALGMEDEANKTVYFVVCGILYDAGYRKQVTK